MNHQISKPNPTWNVSLWRITRECRRVATKNGFMGDALSENNQAGTFEQEQCILGLMGEVNGKIAALNFSFVRRIIRNIVLNSGQ